MKIEQQPKEFRPVWIRLESDQEVQLLSECMHLVVTGKVPSKGCREFAGEVHMGLIRAID